MVHSLAHLSSTLLSPARVFPILIESEGIPKTSLM